LLEIREAVAELANLEPDLGVAIMRAAAVPR
jgi:hypothetical protein